MPTVIRHKNHPNRLDALARGETTFVFPCVANPDHKTRYTSSGACVACSAERSARRDAAIRAARPPRPIQPKITRKDRRSHHSQAELKRRAELAAARERMLYGDQRKNRALRGLTHTMNGPDAIDRSRYLDQMIRNGANLLRKNP